MKQLKLLSKLKLHDISQKELCEALKVHKTTMSLALNGKRNFPKDLKERIINYIKEKR